ncbi:gelsolin [Sporothrix schenckii 1099-18]|uniref:Gelsolin-like domain-containing protein n=2 Tax=Sporothrix schenckii TaxID=29908 RepID=U7PM49_SPOS1|nr:gelsolin [Sporothrix schenckii 1099-18]ERS95814.1 hypothetical protein HMPREF1624_07891 [Sporothrix schenckii ATCC 58251]KJR83837.1 gelsolin [Sporothrix schenckii 1099-18]
MAPHNGLVHAKEYDIKDSNVELIGTDIDHRVKYASAATEPAWNNGVVGVQPGLFVWRIEDFQVVPVPARGVGLFYDGDSYIVLHSYQVGRDTRTPTLGHEIFFWLGSYTSQDEAGTAAYKTVELDEFLHGAATQHRELQASPSAAFLAVFPQRLTIRRGGVATGFTHVEEPAEATPSKKTMLLRVFKQPGARTDGGIVVHEVPAQPTSLDDDDVFVLDAAGSDALYVWQGRRCSPMEKAKAAEVAQDLLTPAHTGGVQVLAQDEGRAGVVLRLLAQEAQGGGSLESSARAATSFRSDRPVASTRSNQPPRPQKLWRLSDASGQLSFDLVRDGAASLRDFDGRDVFLWDDAGREVWVWEGRGASAAERAQWLRVAQAYVRQLAAGGDEGYLTPVAKVREGYESPAFLQSLQAAA